MLSLLQMTVCITTCRLWLILSQLLTAWIFFKVKIIIMKGKTNIFLTSFLQFSCLFFLKSALKDCQCSTISKNNFCSQNQVQMSCSCSQLHKRAERIGCMLMEKGKFNPGDHVALVFPPGRQWTGTACKKTQNQTSFTVM